jgi:uncharacterized protein YjiS (DUF1127 family)
MTVIPFHASRTGLHRASRPSRVRRFAEFALAALRDWRRRVRDRNELMSLDDRTLHDIGLSRGDIPYLLRQAAERRSVRPTALRRSWAESRSWAETLRFPPF